MMDSPKFRRKRTSATGARPADDAPSPVTPLAEAAQEAARIREAAAEQARAEAEALRVAEAAAQAKAEEKARRKADLEERARAEALRRVKAARAQREADAAKAREDAERQEAERQRREAEETRHRQEAAEEARHAEAQRREAEKRMAEAVARRDQAKRQAEKRAAAAQREAEQKRRAEEAEAARIVLEQERAAEAEKARIAEEAHQAEQRRIEAEARAAEARRLEEERRAEDAARRKAEAAVPVLPLTDMVPVTRQPDPPAATTLAEKPVADVDTAWAALPELTVEKVHLARNRIITASREDPAHGAFDVLRTRLLQALSENGWRRVAITSPGKDCGKTFTAANLAISLSRQENCRTLLMDLDMRRPSLHKALGINDPGSVGDMLRGMTPPEVHLRRMGRNPVNAGRNIAFALNDRAEPYASELLQDPRSIETLRAIEDHYAPDVVLFDLPPALFYDDVIAARPLFDGVLLVIGGGLTTESEVSEVERRLGDTMPILGMVLNKAEGTDIGRYTY
ncbi:exopolysaccharide biosynthesis protein [Antarctobacter sp.]|uniref:CpsD/CapB family tyrosine-protein kinase n=1 Tax=Antarctobacter sp. TaxID=1872577 RepID=UPI002B27A35C|nr:exopolysaccharide biosynthesis protein [Antarctobacter sp.]